MVELRHYVKTSGIKQLEFGYKISKAQGEKEKD